jgi:hypothetical protein
MNCQPSAMNRRTIATLVITIRPLTTADSRMPRIKSSVSIKTMNTAGRLTTPWDMAWVTESTPLSSGEWHQAYGMWRPRRSSSLLRYSLQAMPTVAAPIAYSRIRSQPMIQATNSPIVA